MSERGAGALFIAHVNAKEGNSIEMVFMNTQKGKRSPNVQERK